VADKCGYTVSLHVDVDVDFDVYLIFFINDLFFIYLIL